jgi:peptide/nickel transport system permease protein
MMAAPPDAAPPIVAAPAGSLRQVLSNPKVLVGLSLLGLFVVLAISHPILSATVWDGQGAVYRPEAGYDPAITHPSGPSATHIIGTDALGRDVLSMLTFATAPTLVVALSVALTAGILATAAGAAAAFWRGPVDGAISHISDAMLLVPAPIALIVVGVRPDLGPAELGIIFGVIYGLGPGAVVLRSQGLAVMAKPFMDAARVSGGGAWWILRRHLIPHMLPIASVQTMVAVTGAVVTAGFIEFLGHSEARLGYGSMVYIGLAFNNFFTDQVGWSVLLAGSIAITLLCAAFYVIGVGLREIVDPVAHGYRTVVEQQLTAGALER